MPVQRTAILHIGAPKAGSTSIQSLLKANYNHWQKQGVLAAGMTGAKGGLFHRTLYFAFHHGSISRVDRMRFRSEDEYSEHRKLQRKLLTQELESHPGCHTLLFSDEYLTRLERASIQDLRRYLENHGVSRFSIVAYVRSPSSLFLSSAQQHIKAHHVLPSPVGWKYEFTDILSLWDSVFPGATSFRPFERSALKNGSVVDDFLEATKATLQDSALDRNSLPAKDSHNLSLTAEGMALLLDYRRRFHQDKPNKFTPDTRQLILALQECAASNKFKTAQLRREWKDYIEASHAAELIRLASEFNVRYSRTDYAKLSALAGKSPPSPPSVTANSYSGSLHDVAELVEEVSPEDYAQISLMAMHKLAQKAAENSQLKRALKLAQQPS
jgi:hypothetical protein